MRTPTAQINSVMPEGNMEELMTYVHKALGSPKTSTIIRSVENNNLTTWPALTKRNITKYLPMSVETEKGHLDQERKNQRFTNSIIIKLEKSKFVKFSLHKKKGKST